MGYQNFFATRLAADIGSSDTTIALEAVPTVTSGRLVLEARNSTQREIISYTGVSGSSVTGVTRGVGGTTAKTHDKTALVEMNVTAEDLDDALGVPEDIVTRFDESLADFVASGCVWTQDSGLNGDMTAGVIYVSGYRLEVDAVNDHAFTASKDTYVDIGTDGVIDYNPVANGASAPALASDHVRIAKVVTDGSGITAVTALSQAPITSTQLSGTIMPYIRSGSTYSPANNSEADIPDTSLTFTLAKDSLLMITFGSKLSSPRLGYSDYVYLYIDGNKVATLRFSYGTGATVASQTWATNLMGQYPVNLAAGSHTIKLRAEQGRSTSNTNFDDSFWSALVMRQA